MIGRNKAEDFVYGRFPLKDHVKPKGFNQRLVKCGDVYELYDYEKPVFSGFSSRGGRHNAINTTEEVKDENRERTLARTRKDIRNIINCNFNRYGERSKFLTLTFEDNVEDLGTANKHLTDFVKRINYQVFGTKKSALKYTCVPEIQWERYEKYGFKVWHFHVVLYNMPYVKHEELQAIWGNGHVYINAIEDVDNVGAYICKYITKESAAELVGKKSVSNSRGLYKPVEIKDKKKVTEVLEHLETSGKFKLKYQNTYTNDYTGDTTYSQYIRS